MVGFGVVGVLPFGWADGLLLQGDVIEGDLNFSIHKKNNVVVGI